MKVIDLLNKIAKGEEVPKEIKIKMSGGRVAPFYRQDYDYINNYTGQTLLECLHEFNLNDEIETTEEKEIEELELEKGSLEDKVFLAKYITNNRYKINELVREINKLKKEGK